MIIDYNNLKSAFNSFGQYVVYPILAGILVKTYQYMTSLIREKRLHSPKHNAKIAIDTNATLGELRVDLSADRAFIFLLSNGTKYVDGSAILKLTISAEVCAPGVSYDLDKFQNIPISTLPEIAKIAFDNKPTHLFVNTMSECRYKRMLISTGVKSVVLCPLNRNKRDLIGFIGLHYFDDVSIITDFGKISLYTDRINEILQNLT